MAIYKTDIRNLVFTLFEELKITKNSDGLEESDLLEILNQFDKFVESEIYPTRAKGDEEGVLLNSKSEVIVPRCFQDAIKQFYGNGWYSLGYPEDIGGMPAPYSLVVASMGLYVGANVALSMYSGLSQGAMNVILQVGDENQKNNFIPPMMEGRWGGTMCLTEAGAGSDVGVAKTTAKLSSKLKNSYEINGVKIFISSGDNDIYENIIHLVLARTPGAPEGTKGLSLFIVPKYLLNKDGSLGKSNHVHCTKIEEKMGIHGSATCELTFGAGGICEGYLIGKENEGMANMFIMMNEARLLCAIQGQAQAALVHELTTQYAKDRIQFEIEIENHADIKRTLLKMRAMTRGMTSLVLYSANLFDFEKEGDENAELEIALLTPICKSYCSDEGFNIAVDAIQVHGGYGFCTEYGIEQFARDIKIATIYEGTNGIQAIDFVMRKTLKDGGMTLKKVMHKIEKAINDCGTNTWASEIGMMRESLKNIEKVLERYSQFSKNKEMNSILASATDFLNLCGNLFISWRLLESALISKQALISGDIIDKKFYESKIVDLKVFCQHYLTRNTGLTQSILNFNQGLAALEV